jgi:hypothetical protein
MPNYAIRVLLYVIDKLIEEVYPQNITIPRKGRGYIETTAFKSSQESMTVFYSVMYISTVSIYMKYTGWMEDVHCIVYICCVAGNPEFYTFSSSHLIRKRTYKCFQNSSLGFA